MDSGIWAIFLLALPLVSILFIILLIWMLHKKQKKDNGKHTNKGLIIALIIILSIPVANIIIKNIENAIEWFNIANVENIQFEIEEINNGAYKLYFFDEDGFYYKAKKIIYNNKHEADIYLEKIGKERKPEYGINGQSKTSLVFIKDNKGNRKLVMNVNDY